MDNLDDEKKRRCNKLLKTYSQIRESGTGLYISATPEEVANLCVQEECTYMADYIYDDDGVLIQIRFDRIKPQ